MLTRCFLWCIWLTPLLTAAQVVHIKPHTGTTVCLNYMPKQGNTSFLHTPMAHTVKRWLPYAGLDIAFVSKNRWGVAAGVSYYRNSLTVTAQPVDGFVPEYKFYDYNLWFPLKVLYELPLKSGERTITFSAGVLLGYNHYLINKTEAYLIRPAATPGNFSYYSFAGYQPYGHKKFFQAGINAGVEVQPFEKLNGLLVGVDYGISFLKTAERYPGVYEQYSSGSFNAVQMQVVAPRQQYLSLRLLYSFAAGKHTNYSKWKFLNTTKETDSLRFPAKRERPVAEVTVPEKGVTPYINISAGWVQHINSNRQQFKAQRIKFTPAALGYGVQAGVNYLLKKNIGIGAGFSYSMNSYYLKTLPTTVAAYGNSYHYWQSTISRYLVHVNFVYRYYWQPNNRHVEYIPSLYAGVNRYLMFGYGESYQYGSGLNNMYSSYSKGDNFVPKFTCGMANTLLVHPFPKNTGLKFGLTSYLDFVPLPAMTYSSVFSNNNGAEYEEREVNVKPLLWQLYFTVSYSPLLKVKSRQR